MGLNSPKSIAYTTESTSKKGFNPIIPISRYLIYQAVAEVDLIVFNVWTWDIEDYFIIRIPDAHVCAHLAGVTAHARGGELDPCGCVPAVWSASGQCQTATDGGHTVTAGGGQQL